MKKTLLNTLALATLFFASTANAQVGVGVPAGDIHPSAELEVKSTTKGFLPPRMTNAERNSIATPATGLLIYQTDAVANNPAGLYFYDGTAWRNGIGAQGEVGPKGDKGETGAQGLQGANGLPGAAGPKGDAGLNGLPGAAGSKGDKGDRGDTGAQGVQGTQGQNTLAKTTTEAAGANCITGGVKIEYGFDANNSGTLDDAEINPALTKYVCNGIQGPIGEKGLKGDVGPKGDQGGVTSKIYTIGLWPELGGYVFKISADGTHGLVAETQDQSVASSWYLAQDAISNPVNHSTNGKKFMDWRLPTQYELNEMYLQKGVVGGFANDVYWSSTEYGDFAWLQDFGNGYQGNFKMGNYNYVRSVRAF